VLHQLEEVGLELQQADGQRHDLEVDVLDDDPVGGVVFLGGHEDVQHLLGAQLRAVEFDHELVLFVDGEDAASVQVAADRVQGHHFLTHAQLRLFPSLNSTEVPGGGMPEPAP